jgi:phosphoenolpyruvate carboxykinase (GTP)
MVSETTAAATGATGVPRHDPMAMLPFCGYNMSDYFKHWLEMGRKLKHPPKIFHVNWFRQGKNGAFLWPGFGENIRVMQWMIDRIHGDVDARSTLLGYVPSRNGINLNGLDMGGGTSDDLFDVDADAWAEEADEHLKFLRTFGPRLPDTLLQEQAALVRRVAEARASASASAAKAT